MKQLLAIESSTTVCSVALFQGGTLKSLREINDGYRHAELLTTFVREVLEEADQVIGDLDAIVVSKGPGSYTGLRIGVSTAKGICFAAKIPLIGITAIEAVASHLALDCGEDDLIMPMIDAGRMEVYTATYNKKMELVEPLSARIISPESLLQVKSVGVVILAGNGAEKCRGMFSDKPSVIIRSDVLPSAKWFGIPAAEAFEKGHFEDVAYFEPLYLKEFQAGKPRVKGL
jgi:tRNA threonylcarbamoyladenosine biosynthesis protein TsaB